MIQNLEAKNLNGRTFAHTLAPLTIITGNNAAGKSTVKDAITLATLGTVPGYPATNAGVMDNFASGPSLSVAIQTAAGTFSRSWQRSGKSVKADSAGDEAVAKALAPALFSGEQFIAAKPAQRANMLRAAFPTAADPKEWVRDAVSKENGPADSDNIRDLPFDEWVEAYLAELGELAKGFRATIKRMKGVIQGLTQLDADNLPATVTKEELGQARKALGEATQRLGAAEQAARSNTMPREELPPNRTVEIITAELAKREEQRAALDAELRTGAEFEKNALAAYSAACRIHEEATYRHSQAAEALQVAIAAGIELDVPADKLDRVLKMTKAPAESLAEAELQADRAKELSAAAQLRLDVAEAELAGMATSAGDGCTCATCGAAKEHWQAEYLKLATERIEAAAEKVDAAHAVRALAAAAAVGANQALESTQRIVKAREAALTIQAANIALGEHPKPSEGLPKPPPVFDAQALQARLYDLDTDILDDKDDLAAWARQADLEARVIAAKEAAEALVNAQAAHLATAERIAELQEAFNAGIAAAESLAKQQQAEQELAEADKGLAIAEYSADLVKGQAALESQKVLAPMLAVANTFTDGILLPPMSNVGLDIGRWHGAQWQPIARLSGAEKAMVVAALSAALAQAGNKLVLIDEFSVIDDNWKPRFLANLKTAQENGLIEQAIVLDNRRVTSDGWTNIDLKA